MATGSKQAPQPQLLIDTVTRINLTPSSGNYIYYVFKADNSTIIKDGYTALGIVGWQVKNSESNGSGATYARVNAVYLESSTEARLYMTNTSSSTGKIDVSINVLYVKD